MFQVENKDDCWKLKWDSPLYVKIGGQRDIENTLVYLMICLNTESEISFIDQMLANFELKLTDYLDQRQRLIKFDVQEEDTSSISGSAKKRVDSGPLPQFEFSLRFCHSRSKFQERLIKDMEALILKENE